MVLLNWLCMTGHLYCVAKGVGAPIFHVNGDDIEAVVSVCRLAVEWRQHFKRDVVVDIVCYRRHGHNSQDDPSITQPLTYQLIRDHPTALQIYEDRLVKEGIITKDYSQRLAKDIWDEYENEFQLSKHYKPDPLEWFSSNWQGKALGSLLLGRPYNQTGVRMEILLNVGKALTYVPSHIKVHKDVDKILKARLKSLEAKDQISMGFAESLAFGCLMTHVNILSNRKTVAEAYTNNQNILGLDLNLREHPSVHIRLSGQDVIRGTFNQRHAAIYCQDTNEAYWQLNNLKVEQATINVCNSSLSEAAILGFEYGYSLENEMALTVWEAQFGDFANNAQAIIDNFIVSGESKWNNYSSLVMLLPHGHDGQGPEHSSARLERFLQLVDDDPDIIPGINDLSRDEIDAGFEVLCDRTKNGVVTREEFTKAMLRYAPHLSSERVDLALAEILAERHGIDSSFVTKESWSKFMNSWLQKNSERKQNCIVVCPSTPAQYFHCLRRQIHRPYAKPLIVMSSKWLLHHKPCVSKLDDMATGTFFQRIILEGERGDNMKRPSAETTLKLAHPNDIKRVIFCSGKIFYHLYHARSIAGINNITFIRLEQISPFPYDLLSDAIMKYPSAELVWCQEEPKNMGAWSYVKQRFDTCLRENGLLHRGSIKYVGRLPAASPATGVYKVHMAEQREVIEKALRI